MFRKLIYLVSLVFLLSISFPVKAEVFSDDFETPHNYLTDGLGAYDGMLNGTIEALNASIDRAGSLYFQTANGVWDPGPGPLLYKEVTGDFVATVKVTDFAGETGAIVEHNDSGIVARDPADDGADDWVSVNYFPTWTAFNVRSTDDGVRSEHGQPAGSWTGVDTFALAAEYPYIQLERVGSDFYFRISADGVNFIPLTQETYVGIYDGTQTPLVISRPDLPATLQVGLMNCTYTANSGYTAFDDFEIVSAEPEPAGPTIAWVSYHAADDEPHADAAAVGFTLAPDIGYTDLLKANGYNVVRVLTSQTPDVEYLNTMDLVIISRTASSGHYSGGGATAWNSITAPMINLNGYTLRSSRLGFTDGTDMPDTTGDVRLAVTDPTHPIFAGIALTDGVMDNPFAEGAVPLPTDPSIISRGISINNNNLDEEGTVLATIAEVSADTGPVGGMVIAELPAGATLQNSSGSPDDVLGGPRLVFLTGSREPSGVTGGQAAALYDLYPDGEQMFLNAVDYMLNIGKPKIIWVDGDYDDNGDGAVDDLEWVDILKAEGYAVDNSESYIELDDAKIAALNAADLIIISRNSNSGDYDDGDEIAQWNAITTPIINCSTHIVRSSRWMWVDSTTILSLTPEMVLADGTAIPGINAEVGPGSFIDAAAGNGTILATGDGLPWIIKWEAGVEFYDGSGQIAGGPRVFFVAGTQETSPEIGRGEMNLMPEALAVFLSIVDDLIPVKPVDPGTEGLVAHYAFENDLTDSSGNGLDGTAIGDPTFVAGVEGMALDFNGDDYVDCGGAAEFSFTDEMTVSTWVNIRSVTTAWMAMVAKGENAWRLGVNNTTSGIHYAFSGGGRGWQAANTATELAFDEWYHVAATYDTNVGATVYIDAVPDASNSDLGGIDTNNFSLLLGDNPEATGRFLDGMLDEIMIYNRALSKEEVLFLAGK